MAKIADLVKKEIKKYMTSVKPKPKAKAKKVSKKKTKKRKGASTSGKVMEYADKFLVSGRAKNRSQAMKMAWRYFKGR